MTATESMQEWDDGGADGDWGDASNWTDAVPTANDRVHIGTSSRDIDTNLAQTGINLGALHIGPAWTGSMSTLQIDAAKLVIEKDEGDLAISGTLRNTYVINTAAGSTALSLGGTLSNVFIYGGRGLITIANSATVGSVFCIPRKGHWIDLSIGSSVAGQAGTLTVRAAGRTRVASASDIDVLHMVGDPYVEVTGSAALTSVTLDGGLLRHKSSGSITGTNIGYKGRLTLEDNENSAVTVNGFTLWPGCKLELRAAQNALSTTGITYYGGRIEFEDGATVTVS